MNGLLFVSCHDVDVADAAASSLAICVHCRARLMARILFGVQVARGLDAANQRARGAA